MFTFLLSSFKIWTGTCWFLFDSASSKVSSPKRFPPRGFFNQTWQPPQGFQRQRGDPTRVFPGGVKGREKTRLPKDQDWGRSLKSNLAHLSWLIMGFVSAGLSNAN